MAVKKNKPMSKVEPDSPLSVEIDVSKFILGDYLLFARAKRNETTDEEMVMFLDRVIVGGALSFPMASYAQVLNAVTVRLGELSNPK
jgi:hypothetical protein